MRKCIDLVEARGEASCSGQKKTCWEGGKNDVRCEYFKPLLFDCYAGIKTLGLYRIGGVNSKVQKLMTTVFCKQHRMKHELLLLLIKIRPSHFSPEVCGKTFFRKTWRKKRGGDDLLNANFICRFKVGFYCVPLCKCNNAFKKNSIIHVCAQHKSQPAAQAAKLQWGKSPPLWFALATASLHFIGTSFKVLVIQLIQICFTLRDTRLFYSRL